MIGSDSERKKNGSPGLERSMASLMIGQSRGKSAV
jgi:hypothetical protein